jgi:hypothetical protein
MNRLRFLVLLAAVSWVAACGDDSTSPTEAVAGTYHATRADLTFAGSSDVVDGLAVGISVDIVLTPQGTTSGTLVIPALLTEEGLEDDVFDLTGTFTVTGNTVMFQGQGGNLIPTVPWTIGNGTLTASDTQAAGTFLVTLTRS